MIYQKKQAEQILLKACREMTGKGLVVRTWGNASIRLSKDLFLITPSGRSYETLKPEDLVTVGIRDMKYQGDVLPSSEMEIHSSIYRLRKDADFVVHTHQPNASAVSVLGESFVLTEKEEQDTLGWFLSTANYGMSSSGPLAANVRRALRRNPDAKAFLMKNHGALCMGATYEEAFHAVDTLEKVCGRIFEERCECEIPTACGELLEGEIDKGYMMHVRTPFIMEMSKRGKSIRAYLDDQAQISGYEIRCIDPGDRRALNKAADAGMPVMIRNDGAIVFGKNKEEAGAAAAVLEKNCQAAMLAIKTGVKPIDRSCAELEHKYYVNKYAPRKE